MTSDELDALRARFDGVAQTIGDQLAAASPRVIALVAKWAKDDLVPGLSDMDFRVVCDESTTADEWVEIDKHVGHIHHQMVAEHPEWNRINEHTAGAGVNLGELAGSRLHHPEYPIWTVWWGQSNWAAQLQTRTLHRPLNALDEQYHLSRFLAYYSPYIHGIDPPINLAEFEPKYALHSRCWHYFAPPMTSAATLLARRHFSGKREALQWLADNHLASRQVRAVFEQVDAHYETKEQTDEARLEQFEKLLFSAFEELLQPVCGSIEKLALPPGASRHRLQQHLNSHFADPLVELLENVRYSRVRAGRYFFYLNAPSHFSAELQLTQEQAWTKKLLTSTWKLVRALLGEAGLTADLCIKRLELDPDDEQRHALQFMTSLAASQSLDGKLRAEYSRAIELFPHYYMLLESAFAQCWKREQTVPERDPMPLLRVDNQEAIPASSMLPAATRAQS